MVHVEAGRPERLRRHREHHHHHHQDAVAAQQIQHRERRARQHEACAGWIMFQQLLNCEQPDPSTLQYLKQPGVHTESDEQLADVSDGDAATVAQAVCNRSPTEEH